MQRHKFVFSDKPYQRLLRHGLFWMAWWLYFSVAFYFLQQVPPGRFKPLYVTLGPHLLLKTSLLIFVYTIASYTFIYLLLPQIISGKWFKPAANTILLGTTLLTIAYFLYWTAFPLVDSLFAEYKPARFPTRFWPAVSLGLIEPLKVIAAAGIIKYVKYWWLKKEEGETLERERIEAELQLLKAQIHPTFLFNSLNNIYAYSRSASPCAPEMLLKLSDILSFMLYECDHPFVSLEKEVQMIKDYVALEKTRMDNAIEIECSVRGDMEGKAIAPFLLLPFVENSFRQSYSPMEQAWINMDITIEHNTFFMKLAHGIIPGKTALASVHENGLTDVQKRLTLIYPQTHELKLCGEREMLIVLLKIDLTETVLAPHSENEQALVPKQTLL